jgi:hypothetical protein
MSHTSTPVIKSVRAVGFIVVAGIKGQSIIFVELLVINSFCVRVV